MSDVQGMRALEGPAPAAPNGGGAAAVVQTTPLIAAYRRFLAESQVENEFHTVKALAHRASSTGEERLRLTDRAATAEVEAGRLARADDEDLRPRLAFLTGTAVACLLAAVDAVPAFLAAQAFGLDQLPTIGITVVLVAALACAMWAAAHYRSGWRRWLVVSALAAGLVTIGLLRWWYLVVTAINQPSTLDDASAVLDAVGLTIFTTLLVWLGVVVLSLTKARHVSQAEGHARTLRRRGERAARQESELVTRFEVVMREFMGRAQVFSTRNLDDEDSRHRFVDLVRAEVEK
jgi:hypothetical protein